jgi:plasmid maintenance system antidote protein VapI
MPRRPDVPNRQLPVPLPEPFVPAFEPDYAVKPGETIIEMMEHAGLTRDGLAVRASLTRKELDFILEGGEITAYVAQQLGTALGMSPSFILQLDQRYRATLARLRVGDGGAR